MSLAKNDFVIFKKGETPDPNNGIFYFQAVPKILQEWGTNKDLELYNCEDGSTLGRSEHVALSVAYAAHLAQIGHLKHMQVRDSAWQQASCWGSRGGVAATADNQEWGPLLRTPKCLAVGSP